MLSLACFFVYALGEICGRSLFRTRNHTLHSPLCICVGGLSVGEICGRSFFRTSNIHTLHSLVICVRRLIVSRFCYVCGCLFLERVIFTHLFACLFVLNSSLACMVASRLRRFVTSRLRSSRFAPTWRPVSDRHDPSTSRQLGDPCRIVTIRQLFQG